MINTEGFFNHVYKNARENSVIVMSAKGIMLQINQSFMDAFGYSCKELEGKHLRKLFNSSDKKLKKPEMEIESAMAHGSKSDNNYLVHKDGTQIWVMGESVRVANTDGEEYLVKIIHNIHAQKQLERFLLNSNEFISTIFESVKASALLLINTELRLYRCNIAFLKMFSIKPMPDEGTKLSKLNNSFWRSQELRKALMNMMVKKRPMKNVEFIYRDVKGIENKITITAKFIEAEDTEKSILLVINKY